VTLDHFEPVVIARAALGQVLQQREEARGLAAESRSHHSALQRMTVTFRRYAVSVSSLGAGHALARDRLNTSIKKPYEGHGHLQGDGPGCSARGG